MPNETVQTPQVPSGNVAAAQATLSVPAATAQVSSAAPAAEQETLEVHICFLVNFLYFMPSYSFRLACSFRLLVFVLRVFCFIVSPVFSPFYASFTFPSFMLRVCLHMAVLYVICLNLFACCSGLWDFGDFLSQFFI